MRKTEKTIHEPEFVRPHDAGTGRRAGFVLLALILLGALMYLSKDHGRTVAERPNPSPITTGSSAR